MLEQAFEKDITRLSSESISSGTKCMESRVSDLESTTTREFRSIDVRLTSIESTLAVTLPYLATKADLLRLENEVNQRYAGLRTEMTEMRADLRTEMTKMCADLRAEMRTEMTGLRTEMRTEMTGLRTSLQAQMADLQTGLRTEMRTEMTGLRTGLQAQITDLQAGLQAEMGKMRGALMKWVVATSFATLAIVVTLIVK